MDEFQVYDKNGLFHNVVKKSIIMAGRYAILSTGSGELNRSNLLSGIELPTEKYPLVACLPPISNLKPSLQEGQWERMNFRLLFLCRSHTTGDNEIKSRDHNTNTSQHTISRDWNDMKKVALSFMNALERTCKRMRDKFRLSDSSDWNINRITEAQNDKVNGVLVQFSGSIFTGCTFEDITDVNIALIDLPAEVHTAHYH